MYLNSVTLKFIITLIFGANDFVMYRMAVQLAKNHKLKMGEWIVLLI